MDTPFPTKFFHFFLPEEPHHIRPKKKPVHLRLRFGKFPRLRANLAKAADGPEQPQSGCSFTRYDVRFGL